MKAMSKNKEQLNEYYITFGCTTSLKDVAVFAQDVDKKTAMYRVQKCFGSMVAFIYDKDEWYEDGIPQHEKYGYRLLSLKVAEKTYNDILYAQRNNY